MPLLAGSAGGNGERAAAICGEVVVSDVVFAVNSARGELTTPGHGTEEQAGKRELGSGAGRGAAPVGSALGLERRAHPRATLAGRAISVASRSDVIPVPRCDDLDR